MGKAAKFWVETVCDNCATSENGEFVHSKLRVQALTQKVENQGWMLLSTGEWLCGTCANELYDKIRKAAQLIRAENNGK